MICKPCQNAADYPLEETHEHCENFEHDETCKRPNWCDCAHMKALPAKEN